MTVAGGGGTVIQGFAIAIVAQRHRTQRVVAIVGLGGRQCQRALVDGESIVVGGKGDVIVASLAARAQGQVVDARIAARLACYRAGDISQGVIHRVAVSRGGESDTVAAGTGSHRQRWIGIAIYLAGSRGGKRDRAPADGQIGTRIGDVVVAVIGVGQGVLLNGVRATGNCFTWCAAQHAGQALTSDQAGAAALRRS